MVTPPPHRLTTTQAIKDLILERGLRPGDPMPTENDLVSLLGVSRANLREAVRTLVALDILEVRHGTGTFVGEMSMSPLVEAMAFRGVLMPGDEFAALRQIVEIRQALDLALAPETIAVMADGDPTDLQNLCDEMDSASLRGEEFAEADRAFHLGLARRMGNDLYGELVAAFWDVHTRVAPKLGLATPRDIRDTALAHQAMLQAAIDGDIEDYRKAVTAHYLPLMSALPTAKARTASRA